MKIFKSLILSFAIAGMGLFTAACGTTGTGLLGELINVGASALTSNGSSSSTKNTLITTGASVLSSLLSANAGSAQKGTAQSYSGKYTAQLLTYSSAQKGFVNSGSMVSTTATSTLTVGSSSVGITIPAVTANKAAMSQVTLTNLTANNGVYNLSDNSTVTEGQLTYNGKTYDLANAYVELKYSGTTSLTYTASIYFNYDTATQQYLYAMNVTFTK